MISAKKSFTKSTKLNDQSSQQNETQQQESAYQKFRLFTIVRHACENLPQSARMGK
jgi:hypothetical protein